MPIYPLMIERKFWLNTIEQAWRERSVIWLAGVRRIGKTCLCQSLPEIEYFDCELPRVRRMMDDPEGFLEGLKGRRIVLDEIHRLKNPSELLKITADHFPDIMVIATGSSTLGASRKFRDTLAGRKRDIRMTPITAEDMHDFKNDDIKHRFLHGGLPPFFMSKSLPEKDFQEWMDAYWAKDIQELFQLERRSSFLRFFELLLAQSGGIFEAGKFASPCEVSRSTISNYLKVLEATLIAHIIRPFSTRRATEIVAAPKVYGFDTGFVCYFRGWHSLRREDMGILWEHFILIEMNSVLQGFPVMYWRDKSGHEVDFIINRRGKNPVAIECKWSADDFDPKNLLAFRRQYPKGNNYVVSYDVQRPFQKTYNGIIVEFINLKILPGKIS